jgi:hypothetical protein
MCGQSEVRWKMAWEMSTDLTNTVWPAAVMCLPCHGTNLADALFSKGQKSSSCKCVTESGSPKYFMGKVAAPSGGSAGHHQG